MTEYEELLSGAVSGLRGGGLAAAIGAAASVFEAIRLSADAYAGTEPELFATWLMTAAEAADGRDALLRPAPERSAPLVPAPGIAAGQLARLARALTDLLAEASGRAGDPADVAACERAAACAERIHDLLAQDTS
ncbi:MAG TPA: hypothetical protein VNF47_26560 [Streptosporangiaceae bacterium]|nr:hypothetical protein [Streptosporangiaceae bacterium]